MKESNIVKIIIERYINPLLVTALKDETIESTKGEINTYNPSYEEEPKNGLPSLLWERGVLAKTQGMVLLEENKNIFSPVHGSITVYFTYINHNTNDGKDAIEHFEYIYNRDYAYLKSNFKILINTYKFPFTTEWNKLSSTLKEPNKIKFSLNIEGMFFLINQDAQDSISFEEE